MEHRGNNSKLNKTAFQLDKSNLIGKIAAENGFKPNLNSVSQLKDTSAMIYRRFEAKSKSFFSQIWEILAVFDLSRPSFSKKIGPRL